MYSYSTDLWGSIEDLSISDITLPTNQLRSNMNNLEELAESIRNIGLLQPIIVRSNNSENFEIVAGNRRFSACKKLGLRKIPCHIVELDDKKAFEVSVIENVQRRTLNPIDEGLAFQKYVNEFGWGSVSELAKKLSKSKSYVCKRIKLIELPKDVKELISNSEVKTTIGEELFPINDKHVQSKLARLIQEKRLSSRMVRKIIKEVRINEKDKDFFYYNASKSDSEIIHRSFDKAIIALRISVRKLATIIENLDGKWMLYDILMEHKHVLHQQIDLLIKEKRKYKKNSLILRSYF
jgi:ParB family transcriptional regulator, chromosome partitioning protein